MKVFRYTERGTAWWRNNTLAIQHIYPAGAIGLDSPPEEIAVARNTLNARSGWFDGNGTNSFYPAAVRVGYDPKIILDKLREVVARLGAPNGFLRRNPHGIENCSTFPNTINEMLLTSHSGVLRLFSVWPKDKDARFATLRARGAFLVSAELKDGVVLYVEVHSGKGRACTLINPWPGRSVTVTRGNGKTETISGARLAIHTQAGDNLQIVPR